MSGVVIIFDKIALSLLIFIGKFHFLFYDGKLIKLAPAHNRTAM